ncbi:MAG: hypothetical protein HC936_15770 [Leptolyngbyaceae cyanobacterium SU_3_3]|nr:hypothetical protein [Leptolyngbyaceae cyanobacterium SU_3_3]
MAVLHGSWIFQTQSSQSEKASTSGNGCLLIWGETWRRLEEIDREVRSQIPTHPYAMNRSELLEFLHSLQQSKTLNLSF